MREQWYIFDQSPDLKKWYIFVTKVILSAHLDQKWEHGKWDCKGKDSLSFGTKFGRRTSLQLPLQLSADMSFYKTNYNECFFKQEKKHRNFSLQGGCLWFVFTVLLRSGELGIDQVSCNSV